MGSAFRLSIWAGPSYDEAVNWCHSKCLNTYCAAASAETTHTQVDWTTGSALLLGPESDGFDQAELELAGESVGIPMAGEVESLNVSVAAGVVLFEAARQRGFGKTS